MSTYQLHLNTTKDKFEGVIPADILRANGIVIPAGKQSGVTASGL